MHETHKYAPGSAGDIVELVTAAIANEQPLEVAGNRTKSALGRPMDVGGTISTRAMRGINFYEPSELVVSLAPGTTMRELTDLLDQHGQELAFEPIDYGRLYGSEPQTGTVAGMVAVNASGPRRISACAHARPASRPSPVSTTSSTRPSRKASSAL